MTYLLLYYNKIFRLFVCSYCCSNCIIYQAGNIIISNIAESLKNTLASFLLKRKLVLGKREKFLTQNGVCKAVHELRVIMASKLPGTLNVVTPAACLSQLGFPVSSKLSHKRWCLLSNTSDPPSALL